MIELEWFMVFGIFVAGMVVMFAIHEIGRYINSRKSKKTSWFVLEDMGYDGTTISRFEDRAKARDRYEENVTKVGKYYEGVILIEGNIIENEKWELVNEA